MKLEDTTKVNGICGKCEKEFSAEIQFFYDSIPDGKKFSVVTCPFCGTEDSISFPFLFFDRNEHILYTVFASADFNGFERIKLITDELLIKYLSNSSFKEQMNIKKAERRYVEKELFLKIVGIDDSTDFILGQRKIRFTPPPSVSISDEYCFLSQFKNYNLSKNDIAFSSNGLSIFQKDIITETCNRLNHNGFSINLIDIEEERQPSVTCGFLNIALTVGSVLIIPILVNVISDIISDLRHKKDEAELALKKNDDIRVTISEDGTKKVYCFEGNPDGVAQAMKKCGQSSMQTLSLKECHVAIAIDNMVMDGLFQSSFNHQTFNEIAKEYQKVFHPKTSIEIIPCFSEYEESEEIICYKAFLLMKEGDYKGAYWIMRPYLNSAKNIEFFYNFSICISHLGVDETMVLDTYEHVIRKYLSCADLKDLEKFDGNFKQSELNKSTHEMINKGIFIKDEEGVVSTPEPQTEEEIQNFIDGHNEIWRIIHEAQKYEIEDLKQEAYLNSVEVQLSDRLDFIETSLNTLVKGVADNAIDQINKWRNLKEKGDITEEEWRQGLIKDQFINDAENDSEDDSVSEQFDLLLREKIGLEELLEKVRSERHELHTKHQKKLV